MVKAHLTLQSTQTRQIVCSPHFSTDLIFYNRGNSNREDSNRQHKNRKSINHVLFILLITLLLIGIDSRQMKRFLNRYVNEVGMDR